MPTPKHTKLWCQDPSRLSSATVRAGLYALRLLHEDPKRDDRGLLGALWPLVRPLLETTPLAVYLADHHEGDVDQLFNDDNDDFDLLDVNPMLDGQLRARLHRLFQQVPRTVMHRLAAAEQAAAHDPTVALLATCLELDPVTVALLDFLVECDAQESLRALLRQFRAANAHHNRTRLARALGLDVTEVHAALARQAPLRRLGLIEYNTFELSDLEDALRPSMLLRELFDAAPRDVEALLSHLIEPAPAPTWPLVAFPHLAEAGTHLRDSLHHAATQGMSGVNALLHGAPGTGKTELARALAAACGLRAYQVRSADPEGNGLMRHGRLAAYQLAQRLLARRRDALLIFDEIEDVFDSGIDHFALLHGIDGLSGQKGWMNRILEENPVPAIWITNSTEGMDPAFLRRFLLPLACTTPPRSVRRRIAESHLGDRGLPPALLDTLAADAALSPAQLSAARRLLELRPAAPPETTIRHGLAAMRRLLHGAPTPPVRRPGIDFDVAFLNLAGGIAPSALVQALDRSPRASLCFYGPPGTGKTAFAEILAEALDRELIAHRASDLLSPYVGETEQNLARLFRDSDPTHSLLLLDEVDSFLGDRRQARHHWERTQVNELLQQMEQYPGIVVAATNLLTEIDAAALRRFDFKLHFRPLAPAQRLALFAREVFGDVAASVPPDLARHLAALETLTPGDFATVARQRRLLAESLTPEQFLRRLLAECRLKGGPSLAVA